MAKSQGPVSGANGKPDETDKDLIRQGERTIDNLKRLFAFVFAFSFGVIAAGAYGKLEPIFTKPGYPIPSIWSWLLALEMLAVFGVTAGVFYHQGTKSLDIRYAKHPLAKASPGGLAVDYLVQFGTMLPFYLMAYSLGPAVTSKVGYTWFFFSYIILISWGLLLLIISSIRHSSWARAQLRESLDPQEIVREGLLRTYWLLMNSVMLMLIIGMFWTFVRNGYTCATSAPSGQPRTFLFFFGLLAFTRDVLDYLYAWRFTYPIHEDRALELDRWPITRMRTAKKLWIWTVPAYIAMLLAAVLIFDLQMWDIGRWVAACIR